jgi:hypothetical protein
MITTGGVDAAVPASGVRLALFPRKQTTTIRLDHDPRFAFPTD